MQHLLFLGCASRPPRCESSENDSNDTSLAERSNQRKKFRVVVERELKALFRIQSEVNSESDLLAATDRAAKAERMI